MRRQLPFLEPGSILRVTRVVVGAVNGQFPAVFHKIETLHSKHSFAFAVIVGSLFANPENATEEDNENIEKLLGGSIKVPLSTYFALGSHGLPEKIIDKLESAGEVCENLYFLGKRTTIKTSEGIRIVALGGVLDPNITAGISKDKYPPFYNESDARALRGAHSTDVLVTNQWPAGIRTGSKVAVDPDAAEPPGQQCVSDLCAVLTPKYHFSTSPEFFYEREPFFHVPHEKDDGTFPTTRFISLAAFNNAKKQRWIYALTVDPNAAAPVSVPQGATASPLALTGKKRANAGGDSGPSYRFSAEERQRGGHRNKRNRAPPPTPAECFFCLSNPNLATHLITSIGDDAYLTTAKGPLSTPATYPDLPFPCHVLVIPLTHAPTLAQIDPAGRAQTLAEMRRYRAALNAMLAARSRGALGSATWEVSRAGGVHAHWQFLPVPADLLARGLVAAAFRVEAENEKYPALEARGAEADAGEEEEGDFFRVVLWRPGSSVGGDGGGVEESLVLPLDGSFRFGLQFGRTVMAKLLGLEGRTQWQDCGQSQEDETADAEAFKRAFKEFDFSAE